MLPPNTNSFMPRIGTLTAEELAETVLAVMRRVYLWMCLGLFVTAGVAFLVSTSSLVLLIASQPLLFYGLIVGELVLVMAISFGLSRMSPGLALVLFFVYAALNGVTLSMIFLIYTLSSIGLAFFATACLFGAMSIVGYTTKVDLTRFRGFFLMALLGLIIASVINLFLASTVLDWILTYAGIALFLGLTVYDTQRIKRMVAEHHGDEGIVARIGVMGALALYLDFINLFLRLLRIMGRRR